METLSHVAAAATFMAVLGVALSLALAVANRKLWVYEDPRIPAVEDLLPKSNCGGCGLPGCRSFAEHLVAGKVVPAQCCGSAPAGREDIARLLGIAVGTVAQRVARLACAGGQHVAYQRARYAGLASCRAATAVSGGGKECAWGCLGLGDCVAACGFGALSLDQHGLPRVDVGKCVACGDCVGACPKNLFSLEPLARRLWVACRNRAPGPVAEAACTVACTACGRCEADGAPGLIRMDGNLAVIDSALGAMESAAAIARCPTGAIVWYDDPATPRKGAGARKILRQQPLPLLQ